jgi:DNA polymerase III alpha subunit
MWNENNSIDELTQGVILHGIDVLENCQTSEDLTNYIQRIDSEYLNYPIPKKHIDPTVWFIPEEYKTMNIEEFLVDQCPKENYDRLIKELELYQKNNMMPVLRAMKYVVDTLRSNNIVWGVGRGSSVASYVLYLIGVHKIDSVKYKLPIEEFFKEKING